MVQFRFFISILKHALIKCRFYCTLQYFTDYYDRIHSPPNRSLPVKVLSLLYYSLCAYHISLFLTFLFFTPTLSRQTNLLLLNCLYFEEIHSFHNIWAISSMFTALYNRHLLNSQNTGITSTILQQILLQNDNSKFLNPILTLDDFPLIKKCLPKWQIDKFPQIPVSVFLQKLAIYTRNILQVSSLGLCKKNKLLFGIVKYF